MRCEIGIFSTYLIPCVREHRAVYCMEEGCPVTVRVRCLFWRFCFTSFCGFLPPTLHDFWLKIRGALTSMPYVLAVFQGNWRSSFPHCGSCCVSPIPEVSFRCLLILLQLASLADM